MASAAFLAVGLARADLSVVYDCAVIAALALGAVGDALLLRRGRAALLMGIVLFGAGHGAYLVAFAGITTAAQWWTGVSILAIACAALSAWYLVPRAGNLALAIVAYTAILAVLIAGGFAASHSRGIAVFVATVLFAVSDLAVARQRLVVRSPHNRLVGLPIYYCAQLLFAWNL